MSYAIVEKKDRHALHGLFDTLDRANRHLTKVIPVYVARGVFDDKTLTAADFEVVPYSRT